MARKTKINLKDRLEDDELDLSLSELQEIPVREIAAIKKATSLDLSNNELETLGKNFITLTHIVKLDLSKNRLIELPENFGVMVQLKHLDLYHNRLTHLPLSFYKLKNLRWLDLKNNPLVPGVAAVAGPCLDQQQCLQCAKNIVKFFNQMHQQIEEEMIQIENEQKAAQEAELINQKKQQKKREKNKAHKAKRNKLRQQKLKLLPEEIVDYEDLANMLNGHVQGPKKSKSKKSNPSFFKNTFYLFSFIIGSLFIFTACKTESSLFVKEKIIYLWNNNLLSIVPKEWHPWFNIASDQINNVHNKTGILCENANTYIQTLIRNENVQVAKEMLWDVSNMLYTEGKKLWVRISN